MFGIAAKRNQPKGVSKVDELPISVRPAKAMGDDATAVEHDASDGTSAEPTRGSWRSFVPWVLALLIAGGIAGALFFTQEDDKPPKVPARQQAAPEQGLACYPSNRQRKRTTAAIALSSTTRSNGPRR